MELRLKVVEGVKQVTFSEAIRKGKIVVREDGLYSDSTKILRSTSLLDLNGHEIFEEDIVADEKGSLYSVVYRNSAFFAESHGGDAVKMVPLYLLQGNGYIPVKISKMN